MNEQQRKEQAYKEALKRMPLIVRYPLPFVSWLLPRHDLKGMFFEGINYQLETIIIGLEKDLKELKGGGDDGDV